MSKAFVFISSVVQDIVFSNVLALGVPQWRKLWARPYDPCVCCSPALTLLLCFLICKLGVLIPMAR
jgi:hypothetical protein